MRRTHITCTVPNCDRPHKARGYCQTHYMQYKRGDPITETIAVRVRDKPPECSEEGCHEPVKSKGLCHMHYQRLLRHGHTRYRDRKKPAKQCSLGGCPDIMYAKGVCHKHYIKHSAWKAYGVDIHVYHEMLEAQNGVCAICRGVEKSTDAASGKVRALAVDHCHEGDKVRGLLCSSCNRGLGLFKDNPALLRLAADYVERHRAAI